jgi:UDP-N-acetylglucosamine 2-epimerase (non-hydrolysing)
MQVDVSVVVGTRPEAIKCAPVVFALRERRLNVRLVATGQHAALLDDALAAFGLSADVNLHAMGDAPDLPGLTSRLIERVAADLTGNPPRMVLVQGDTTTALAGALAAFYARVPCGHIEAGLRSGRRDAPWPEEVNRQLVDRLCTRLYAPTRGAAAALLAEGLDALVTGQTGVDAALWAAGQPANCPAAVAKFAGKRLVFVTLHRRENQSGGIEGVLKGVAAALDAHGDCVAVLALHPNPDVRRAALAVAHPRLVVINPLNYRDSVWMLAHAAAVVSDSGGIQEEAPSFGTPVLVARDVTERPEGLRQGFLRLVGTDAASVAKALAETLADTGARARLKALANPYGDGRAAQRIADDVAGLLKP